MLWTLSSLKPSPALRMHGMSISLTPIEANGNQSPWEPMCSCFPVQLKSWRNKKGLPWLAAKWKTQVDLYIVWELENTFGWKVSVMISIAWNPNGINTEFDTIHIAWCQTHSLFANPEDHETTIRRQFPTNIVGGFNPVSWQKHIRQIGWLPKVQ